MPSGLVKFLSEQNCQAMYHVLRYICSEVLSRVKYTDSWFVLNSALGSHMHTINMHVLIISLLLTDDFTLSVEYWFEGSSENQANCLFY